MSRLVEHDFTHPNSTLTYTVRGVAEVRDSLSDFNMKDADMKHFYILHGQVDVTIYVKDLHEELYLELEEKMQQILNDMANEKEAA